MRSVRSEELLCNARQHASTHPRHSAPVFSCYVSHSAVQPQGEAYFDTICVTPPAGASVDDVMAAGYAEGVNFRKLSDTQITLSTDETTALEDIEAVWRSFALGWLNLAFSPTNAPRTWFRRSLASNMSDNQRALTLLSSSTLLASSSSLITQARLCLSPPMS